jgi:hypothetical protein
MCFQTFICLVFLVDGFLSLPFLYTWLLSLIAYLSLIYLWQMTPFLIYIFIFINVLVLS